MDFLSKTTELTFNLTKISSENSRISSYVSHKLFNKYSIEFDSTISSNLYKTNLPFLFPKKKNLILVERNKKKQREKYHNLFVFLHFHVN